MESLLELYELIAESTFIPVALLLLVLVTVGIGVVRNRFPRSLFLATLIALGVAMYFGLGRHEWGEVLFNGQLL